MSSQISLVKGFETGNIDMMTDGTEEREFLYAEDCCEAFGNSHGKLF